MNPNTLQTFLCAMAFKLCANEWRYVLPSGAVLECVPAGSGCGLLRKNGVALFLWKRGRADERLTEFAWRRMCLRGRDMVTVVITMQGTEDGKTDATATVLASDYQSLGPCGGSEVR